MVGVYNKPDPELPRMLRLYFLKLGTFWAVALLAASAAWSKPHAFNSFDEVSLEALINKAASDLIVCRYYTERDCSFELNRLLLLESMRDG